MYYPYLRGRKHELAAVRATVPQMSASGKIVPIIEPVTAKTRALERTVDDALKANLAIVVVVNPEVGDLVSSSDVLQAPSFAQFIQNSCLIPGFIVTTGTTPSRVNGFLKRYSKRRVCFIHAAIPAATIGASVNSHSGGAVHVYAQNVASAYLSALRGPLVARSDGFNRMVRNSSYPATEFFSDDHMTFGSRKLAGFSDFSVVGDYFVEKGGPAHAVAIHLHHQQPDGLWLNHFVSDRVTGPVDVAGKFAEAVAKLDAFAAKHPKVAATAACAEFRRHHRASHFPGLGVVKQLSIRHHIETIASIL